MRPASLEPKADDKSNEFWGKAGAASNSLWSKGQKRFPPREEQGEHRTKVICQTPFFWNRENTFPKEEGEKKASFDKSEKRN